MGKCIFSVLDVSPILANKYPPQARFLPEQLNELVNICSVLTANTSIGDLWIV